MTEIREYAQQIGREVWMTEAHWRIRLDPEVFASWDNGLNLTMAYSRFLKYGGASSLFYWQMIRNGYATNDGVHPYPILDMLEQLKDELPEGSRIVGTSANTRTLYTVAAQAPSHFALLMTNTSIAGQPVQVRGLPSGTYYLVTSNARGTRQFVRQVVVSDETVYLALDPQSVNVLTTQLRGG
jgi:hypothetical protein